MSHYEIRWSNGKVDGGWDTLLALEEQILLEYPDAVIGHEGDLKRGGDRTLVWERKADSIDDDGRKAIATIVEVTRPPIAERLATILALLVLLLGCSDDASSSPLNCGWDESDVSPLVNLSQTQCLWLQGGPDLNFTMGPDTPCSAPGGTLVRCAWLLPGERVRAWSPLLRPVQNVDRTTIPCDLGPPECTR